MALLNWGADLRTYIPKYPMEANLDTRSRSEANVTRDTKAWRKTEHYPSNGYPDLE